VTPYASATGKGIGNLLDSLPGTGPRTLLGALALVVGFTFWLQPEAASDVDISFDEPVVEENHGNAVPAIAPDPETNQAPSSPRRTGVEVRADTVLR
jgi:hypothetical protein